MTCITPEYSSQEHLFDAPGQRKSITFIMGKDKAGYNYFNLAERHFTFDKEESTDYMVKSCRSFEDLLYYLNQYPEQEDPWGVINVVLHGNVWSGLSLPISNDGDRATPKNLVKMLVNSPLPKLKNTSIDTQTKVNFWGCGIGKNPIILSALDSMIKTENHTSPDLYVSPHFVVFKEMENGGAPKRIKASYWPYIFKRGYRPSASLIAQELKNQYPEKDIAWQEAVETEDIDTDEDVFQNSFHLPVSFTRIYETKKSRPDISNHDLKMHWIMAQDELLDQVDALDIAIDKFHWTVNKIVHTLEDGSKVPAIKAIGMATVLCVVEAI